MLARRRDPGPLLASLKGWARGAAGSMAEVVLGKSATAGLKRLLDQSTPA
jgi:hypothetical protein